MSDLPKTTIASPTLSRFVQGFLLLFELLPKSWYRLSHHTLPDSELHAIGSSTKTMGVPPDEPAGDDPDDVPPDEPAGDEPAAALSLFVVVPLSIMKLCTCSIKIPMMTITPPITNPRIHGSGPFF